MPWDWSGKVRSTKTWPTQTKSVRGMWITCKTCEDGGDYLHNTIRSRRTTHTEKLGVCGPLSLKRENVSTIHTKMGGPIG